MSVFVTLTTGSPLHLYLKSRIHAKNPLLIVVILEHFTPQSVQKVCSKCGPTTPYPSIHHTGIIDLCSKKEDSFMNNKPKLSPNIPGSAIIALYSQLTYCYEVFDKIPILWLNVPSWSDLFGLERSIQQITNNPIVLDRYPSGKFWEDNSNIAEKGNTGYSGSFGQSFRKVSDSHSGKFRTPCSPLFRSS